MLWFNMEQTSETLQRVMPVSKFLKEEKITDGNADTTNMLHTMTVLLMCTQFARSTGTKTEFFIYSVSGIILSYIPLSYLTKMASDSYAQKDYGESLSSIIMITILIFVMTEACFK